MSNSWWKPLLVGAVVVPVAAVAVGAIVVTHPDDPAPRRPIVVLPVANQTATPPSRPTNPVTTPPATAVPGDDVTVVPVAPTQEDDHDHGDGDGGGGDDGDHSGPGR